MEEKKTALPSAAAELSDRAMDEISGGRLRITSPNDKWKTITCKNCPTSLPEHVFKTYGWRCPSCGTDNTPKNEPAKEFTLTIP